MTVEKFVRELGLVLQYARVVNGVYIVGGRNKRRPTRTDQWRCDILFESFEYMILVDKKGPDGLDLMPIWNPKSKDGWFASAKLARRKLIDRIGGRKMIINDLCGPREVIVPADLK